jgi:GT2 family glycosyltransferase
MTNSENISIIIINYNGYDYVKELLKSIKKQNYPIDEILIIDDCSLDNSYNKIKINFPEISLFKTKTNSGPGVARNLGLDLAKNNLILFLDNDAVLNKNTIQILINEYKNNPNYTYYIPRIMYFKNKNKIQKEGTEIHYLGITINSFNINKEINNVKNKKRKIKAFPGVCYLMNIKDKNKILKYDPLFFYTFEDLDYSFSNYLANNKAILVPNAEVYHKDGTFGLSNRGEKSYPSKRLFYLIRNRWYFIIKHYDIKIILLMIPINLFYEFLILLFSLIKSKDKLIFFKSYISLIKNFKEILKKRNPIKINKEIYNQELRINKFTIKNKFIHRFINLIFFNYGKYVLKLNTEKSDK